VVYSAIEPGPALGKLVRFFTAWSIAGDEGGQCFVGCNATGFRGCDVREIDLDVGSEVGGDRGI
jgi:hypothetical protein